MGGITAVLGASGSGKTVLLQALAGRMASIPGLFVSGGINLLGQKLDGETINERIRFCPTTNNHLVGVLTVKEHLLFASKMANPKLDDAAQETFVVRLMDEMGLEEVKDSRIGTVYKRGISGGQQRRVCTAIDLAANASLMVLDEPTSGLDTTTAVNVLTCVKKLINKDPSEMRSAIVTLHQPNNELLDLCDNILLLVEGKSIYFGTVNDARPYITALTGETIDLHTPATEHFLFESDPVFSNVVHDYMDSFAKSAELEAIKKTVLQHQSAAVPKGLPVVEFAGVGSQTWEYFKRDFTIGARDLTLYYLQYALQISYGLLVGFIFINLDFKVDKTLPLSFSAITWLTALNLYVFVFKAMYFDDLSIRAAHERANNAYGVVGPYIADHMVNLLMFVGYFVGTVIAYFIVGIRGDDTGYAAEAFPFIMLLAYFSAYAAEPVPAVVCQFTAPNMPVSFVAVQGAFLVLFMFSGGLFIRDSEVPDGWLWVKKISPFEHATDAFMAAANDWIHYTCDPTLSTDFGSPYVLPCAAVTGSKYADPTFNESTYCCAMEYGTFPCDNFESGTFNLTTGRMTDGAECFVDGRTITEEYKNQDVEKWESLGYLIIFGAGMRFFLLILQFFPPAKLIALLKSSFMKPSADDMSDVRNNAAVRGESSGEHHTIAQMPGKPLDLAMSDISVVLKKKIKGEKKTLVKPLSCMARGGKVTALMGPSGAGKTTLLNAISGMAPYADVYGAVTLGGCALKKSVLGYVPQFDHLNQFFTVRETLSYACHLKCVRDEKEVNDYIAKNAELLGYTDILDMKISALAGGQAKIISVAIGLVANPKALFLDEPTTGLDSTAAHYVVDHVRRVADSGVTVLMTIHQPSSEVFAMADDMILLDSDGNLAYDGPIAKATAYFGRAGFPCDEDENPADIALMAVSKEPNMAAATAGDAEGAATWAVFWKDAPERKHAAARRIISSRGDVDSVEQMFETPSEMARFSILHKKLTIYYWRNKSVYFTRLFTIIIFGLFAGSLYYATPTTTDTLTEVTGVIFFGLWCSLYLCLGNIPTFCEDRFDCENGYASGRHGLLTYYGAQFVASLPYQLMCASIFTVCIHFMPQINETADAFFYAMLVSWVMMLIQEGVNWMLIEKLRSGMLAVTGGMIVLGSLFMFAGFFIHVPDMPKGVAWMAYTLPTYYVFKGHLYNYFHGVSFPTQLIDPATNETIVVNGDELLNDMFDVKFQDDYYMKWMMLLVGFAFAFGFRFNHYVFVYMSTAELGASLPTDVKAKKARASVASVDVSPADIEAIELEILEESAHDSTAKTVKPLAQPTSKVSFV